MGKLMKVLFCGTMVPDNIECQIKDISAAGIRFQNNMIKNMTEMGYEIYQCSFIAVPMSLEVRASLEKENQIKGNKVQHIFKERNIIASVVEYYKKVLKILNSVDIVICYNIIYAWLLLPRLTRDKGKKSIVIIADYSESCSYQNMLRKFYAKLQLWSMRQFDIVVGLSANINANLKKMQRFILMEGGIDQSFYDAFLYVPHKKGSPVTLMYSGLLSPVTGVDLLLRAMQKIDRQDIRLIFTGKGVLEEEVKQADITDERICYRGHLTYEEYMKQLQSVDILINPRNMNLPENQNNFPSKIMEYLAVGKPILSTKFVGWEKFEENIFFCESSEEALQTGIEYMIDKIDNKASIYQMNREKAKQFEWKTQLQRVLE